MDCKYGNCHKCGYELEPVWFTEEEYKTVNGVSYKTGRKRRAVSHLVCPHCFSQNVVDDSFDGNWF